MKKKRCAKIEILFPFFFFLTVTEFSKKTGDYPALSATDLQVIALTYQIEKEQVGTEHLNHIPKQNRVIIPTGTPSADAKDTAGFYLPKNVRILSAY